MEFNASWSLCFAHHESFNGNHALNAEPAFDDWGDLVLPFSHSLEHSPTIADNQKSDAPQLT
jgi:hypothetical protein